MDVGVAETGRHGAAVELEESRPRPDPRGDRRVLPDSHDPAVPDGDRGRTVPAGVHRLDSAAAQDEVG
jgi:hypothetical protein